LELFTFRGRLAVVRTTARTTLAPRTPENQHCNPNSVTSPQTAASAASLVPRITNNMRTVSNSPVGSFTGMRLAGHQLQWRVERFARDVPSIVDRRSVMASSNSQLTFGTPQMELGAGFWGWRAAVGDDRGRRGVSVAEVHDVNRVRIRNAVP